MTTNDMILLKEARNTSYKDYGVVNDIISKADSDDTRRTLKNIRDLLYDVYINGGRTD